MTTSETRLHHEVHWKKVVDSQVGESEKEVDIVLNLNTTSQQEEFPSRLTTITSTANNYTIQIQLDNSHYCNMTMAVPLVSMVCSSVVLILTFRLNWYTIFFCPILLIVNQNLIIL